MPAAAFAAATLQQATGKQAQARSAAARPAALLHHQKLSGTTTHQCNAPCKTEKTGQPAQAYASTTAH
jgi:hypothetical protein